MDTVLVPSKLQPITWSRSFGVSLTTHTDILGDPTLAWEGGHLMKHRDRERRPPDHGKLAELRRLQAIVLEERSYHIHQAEMLDVTLYALKDAIRATLSSSNWSSVRPSSSSNTSSAQSKSSGDRRPTSSNGCAKTSHLIK
jgi:hypothetical protein